MTTTTTTTQPTDATMAVINASIALVSQLLPVAGTAIAGAKAIWLLAHPGKTSDDWLSALATDAATLTSEADHQLIADGWTRNPTTGEWTRLLSSTTAPSAT